MNSWRRERVQSRLAAIPTAGKAIVWRAGRCFVIFLLVLGITQARGQPIAEPQYTEVFYYSGPLRIQAYLYRPLGNGPFPLVIYNQGRARTVSAEAGS